MNQRGGRGRGLPRPARVLIITEMRFGFNYLIADQFPVTLGAEAGPLVVTPPGPGPGWSDWGPGVRRVRVTREMTSDANLCEASQLQQSAIKSSNSGNSFPVIR